ncbi:MAG: hypothetical protein R3F61_38335 [Myxococcota bacterium]
MWSTIAIALASDVPLPPQEPAVVRAFPGPADLALGTGLVQEPPVHRGSVGFPRANVHLTGTYRVAWRVTAGLHVGYQWFDTRSVFRAEPRVGLRLGEGRVTFDLTAGWSIDAVTSTVSHGPVVAASPRLWLPAERQAWFLQGSVRFGLLRSTSTTQIACGPGNPGCNTITTYAPGGTGILLAVGRSFGLD